MAVTPIFVRSRTLLSHTPARPNSSPGDSGLQAEVPGSFILGTDAAAASQPEIPGGDILVAVACFPGRGLRFPGGFFSLCLAASRAASRVSHLRAVLLPAPGLYGNVPRSSRRSGQLCRGVFGAVELRELPGRAGFRLVRVPGVAGSPRLSGAPQRPGTGLCRPGSAVSAPAAAQPLWLPGAGDKPRPAPGAGRLRRTRLVALAAPLVVHDRQRIDFRPPFLFGWDLVRLCSLRSCVACLYSSKCGTGRRG